MSLTVQPLISVRDLRIRFATQDRQATVKAVDGVSFDVMPGETFGIIGESGSGKTTLGRALVSLLPPSEGSILHDGVDPHSLGASALRQHRRDYQIVFQDPHAALNPRQRVLASVCEPLEIAGGLGRAERERRGLEALARVGIAPEYAQRYPHTVAMQAKLQTEQGKADYRKRKWIAEPPNGWIKNVLGFRQFSMRGLQKAPAEFKLVCLALNLRRMGFMQMA